MRACVRADGGGGGEREDPILLVGTDEMKRTSGTHSMTCAGFWQPKSLGRKELFHRFCAVQNNWSWEINMASSA